MSLFIEQLNDGMGSIIYKINETMLIIKPNGKINSKTIVQSTDEELDVNNLVKFLIKNNLKHKCRIYSYMIVEHMFSDRY